MMETVENAYQAIAGYLFSFAGSREWEYAVCKLRVYFKMASGTQWLVLNGVTDELGGFEKNPDAIWEGLDAAVFLRDDLLKTTGSRIWGLTFTLFPDSKFKVEYDYNKPEGYEESDELVTGDEINESVNRLMGKVDPSSEKS